MFRRSTILKEEASMRRWKVAMLPYLSVGIYSPFYRVGGVWISDSSASLMIISSCLWMEGARGTRVKPQNNRGHNRLFSFY